MTGSPDTSPEPIHGKDIGARINRVMAWIIRVAKFSIVMYLMMIVCSIVWQSVVVEYLYDNTDDNLVGFMGPFFGDFWIGQGGFPIVAVKHVVHSRSMSDPDEIKEGWSIPKLFCLWLSLFAISIGLSIWLAKIPWIPNVSMKRIC